MKKIIHCKRVTSDYNNVCYVNSVFALFLYLYINKGGKNTLFISHMDFQELLMESKLENVIIIDSKRNSNWSPLKFKWKLLRFDLSPFIDGKSFFGHDHLTFSYLFNLDNSVILEDGLANLNGPSSKIKRLKRRLKGKVPITFGFSNKTKSIYLSDPSKVHKSLHHKSIAYSNSELIEYSKENSLPLFFNDFKNSLSDECILFTQPLSEGKFTTELEKLDLYKGIIKKYNITLIKPHPRENTDYFKELNVKTLSQSIPAEMLFSKDDINTKLYTLTSTSLFNLKEVYSNLSVTILADDLNQYIKEWRTTNIASTRNS